MRLVFAGTPAAALPSLEALLASPHEVVAVLTRPDATAGRGKGVSRSPVASRADQAGIDVLTPDRPGRPDFLDRLRTLAPACVVVVAYGALIPPAALQIPVHGWINLHFSVLPAWRGAAPVQHALLHGDEVTGATVFQLDEGLDTGPIYGTLVEPIKPADTAGDLLDRLAAAGATLLVRVVDGIEAAALSPVDQPTGEVSLAPKIGVADARVRWTDPAFAVDRRVRATTPEPGAWTTFRGQRIKLGPVRTAERAAVLGPTASEQLEPGQLRVSPADVLVGTATDAVRLGQVQAPGKKAMPAADWARGSRVAVREGFV